MRLSLVLILVTGLPLFAQVPADEARGDPAAAQRYVQWAQQRIADGRWDEALAGLERAADYADVSSDLSLLLAMARAHTGASRGAVLEALERAIEAQRWVNCAEAQARLLEAEQLIALRRCSTALQILDRVPADADAAVLRLSALKGLALAGGDAAFAGRLPARVEFRRRAVEALDRYPDDPRPLAALFSYAGNTSPQGDDLAVMELALRRLPYLIEKDPELAWQAAPFIRDPEEARRLTAAYRSGSLLAENAAGFQPNPASLSPALNLGLVDDAAAVEELFAASDVTHNAEKIIDRDLILSVQRLLRSDAGRELFAQKLHSFTGAVSADDDRDGIPESRAVYREGFLAEYYRDADQDGIAELHITFDGSGPRRGELPLAPDAAFAAPFSLPQTIAGIPRASIIWDRYPGVRQAEADGLTYTFAPEAFECAPLHIIELAGSASYAGLPYPVPAPERAGLGRRSLAAFAVTIQRPGAEFEGALETIELKNGIPLRAAETLNGRTLSITEFENGRPLIQRLDLDKDSRMETVRRFKPFTGDPLEFKKAVEISESDWDGDGIFEYAELYLEDGSVVYSWDMDKNGIREYSEKR